MGYYTDYTVRAGGFANESEITAFLGMLEKQSSYAMRPAEISHNGTKFWVFLNAKWYDWKDDLLAMSRVYPEITIDVDGVGEDRQDMWRARFRDGEHEVVRAEVRFPVFERLT